MQKIMQKGAENRGKRTKQLIRKVVVLTLLLSIFSRVSWQVGYIGLRVGEAGNPGPLKIVSANVTAMSTQGKAVRALKTVCLQGQRECPRPRFLRIIARLVG